MTRFEEISWIYVALLCLTLVISIWVIFTLIYN